MFNFTSFHDNLILYLVYNIILKDEFYLQKKKNREIVVHSVQLISF